METNRAFSASLSPESIPLLSICAFFPGIFSIDWVVEMTGQKASQVLSDLEDGEKKGWLNKKGPGLYSFRNATQRKTWSEKVPPAEEGQIHRHIVALLIREFPEGDEKAKILADHLQRIAQNTIEECRWLMKAGEVYRRGFQSGEALRCYRKVLEDLSGCESEEAERLFMEAAIQFSRASSTQADALHALPILEKAMDRALRWSHQNHQALLEMHLAKNEWLRSQYASAMNHFEKGWALAKKLDDPGLLRQANTFGIWFLFWQGRFREAVLSYERFVPDIQRFSQGRFSLLSAIMVAHCYAQIGQVTQGLGMLDALRAHCRKRGDRSMAAQAETTMGAILLDIRRTDEALQCLEGSVKEGIQERNEWVEIWGDLMLALAYFLREEKKKAVSYLSKFVATSTQAQVTVRPYPYLLELCWAMEKGELARIPELSLEQEIGQMIQGKNIFMKGVAYRYQGLRQRKANRPRGEILRSFVQSLRFLEESGHHFETAKTRLELGREYLLAGDKKRAKDTVSQAARILFPGGRDLIPDDLRGLIKDTPQGGMLLDEILKLGQEVVAIREDKDLVQRIISSLNRITGAERGAIFLYDGTSPRPRLRPRATKNLTSEQIEHPAFRSSLRMIEEVAETGRGQIDEGKPPIRNSPGTTEVIRSRICVPMTLKDRVVGVLYHDNRLLTSVFKETDLNLLQYFGAMAAFALDNLEAYEEIRRLNQKLREEKEYFEEQHLLSIHFEDIIGESPALRLILGKVEQVAGTESTVLILGESGTGKELVARAVHRHSPRRDKPFIRVLCSALPDSLIPSELFGHEKGAFTGAVSQQIGRFELANGGTLFLDEIGDLPLEVQVRLLRVLQTKEFERVGGHETLRSDFRLIAATNRDLSKLVKEQKFRADLYYRINVFPIQVPSLRERKEDIPLLAHYFLKIYGDKMGKSFGKIPEPEMNKLISYDWPGNVRELENIIERGTILSPGPVFRMPAELFGPLQEEEKRGLTMKENERRHILAVLKKTGWRVRGNGGAAEILDLPPSTLASRMKKLGIQRSGNSSRKKSSLPIQD